MSDEELIKSNEDMIKSSEEMINSNEKVIKILTELGDMFKKSRLILSDKDLDELKEEEALNYLTRELSDTEHITEMIHNKKRCIEGAIKIIKEKSK